MKTAVSYEKIAIEYFARKNKCAKPFLPVHMEPRTNLISKYNGRKYRDTVLTARTNIVRC